ncbi:MAG: phosphate acyltransferase PlsX [Ignavibacteriae bacterium]|nr:phosphate acyltransferase PlsX [Ignavibacteriota bacterium]
MRIALDAMGGDYAPDNEVQGAVLAAESVSSQTDLEVIFVGREQDIRASLSKIDSSKLRYSIVHADDIVGMADEASTVVKKKRNSSLFKGIELHADGKADGFVSTGNTGAVMSTATLVLGRVKGVSRPTIGSFFPTVNDRPALLVDAGANIDCKPRHLYEFAIMGSIYYSQILDVEFPKIGLLNVGEERTKGTEVVLQTYELLEQSPLNFIGNVEGRDILFGHADVFVCDGFTGNIILKFAESIIGVLKAKVKQHADKGFLEKLAVGAMAPTLRKILKEFDYQEYGGVPLLGVNGVAIIGHGKSSPKAIQNMIVRAVDVATKNVNGLIASTLASLTIPTDNN